MRYASFGGGIMDNTFKVSLYIRVSTDKQVEGDSLEEQESELKKFCEYKNYLIHKIHIERGRSAKDTKRPEYQNLLKDIKDNKINAVVVKKLDRLSRSLLDFEEFMRIAQQFDVEFISLKENFDTTNAIGKAMLRVALVFAQLEREQTAERISDVMTYRASQGLYNGGIVPFGYYVLSKELFPDNKEKKLIEFMFDKFLELKSTTLVAKELNAIGSRNRQGILWDKKMIHRIIKMPIYIGKIVWKGTNYNGIHQPLITDAKFQQVQNIFNNRTYRSPKNKVHGLLKGFIVCGYCGNNLSPNYSKKKSGKMYHYYRCMTTVNQTKENIKCQGQYIPYKTMHKIVFEKILSYAKEDNLNKLKDKIDGYNYQIKKDLTMLNAELEKLEFYLKNLKKKKEQYLDSLVAGDFSKTERDKINQKIDEFSLEEKQTEASIYRQQFEINAKQETIQNIEPFKQSIIKFSVNYSNMSEQQLFDWLQTNINKIIYTDNEIKISFKDIEF